MTDFPFDTADRDAIRDYLRPVAYRTEQDEYLFRLANVLASKTDDVSASRVTPTDGSPTKPLSEWMADLEALPTSNLSGASVTATGSTTPRSLADRAADWVNVLDYGADPVNGTDSRAAFQRAIDAKPAAEAIGVYIPQGTYYFSGPIISGSRSIIFRGAGRRQTRLVVNAAGADLFQHGLDSEVFYATFTAEHLGLFTSVPGARYAINIKQDETSGYFVLTEVDFSSFSSAFAWEENVRAVGTSFTRFNDVYANGNAFGTIAEADASTQVNFRFISSSNSARVYSLGFHNVVANANVNNFLFEVLGAPGNSGSVEGAIFSGQTFLRTNKGAALKMAVPLSSSVWWPPYFVLENVNYEGPGSFIDADSISELHINNCALYVSAQRAGQPTNNFIRLGSVKGLWVENNTFKFYQDALLDDVINVGGTNTEIVRINNNRVSVDHASAVVTSFARIGLAATDISHEGNSFNSLWSTRRRVWDGVNDWPADPSLNWQSYTPIITAEAGTLGGVSGITGAFQRIGKTVNFRLSYTVTSVGTATVGIRATLPSTIATGADAACFGFNFSTSVALYGTLLGGASSTRITTATAGFPAASGDINILSGQYREA